MPAHQFRRLREGVKKRPTADSGPYRRVKDAGTPVRSPHWSTGSVPVSGSDRRELQPGSDGWRRNKDRETSETTLDKTKYHIPGHADIPASKLPGLPDPMHI